MKTIRISEEVWDQIAARGKFGETPDDVLRRVFNIGRKQTPSKRRYATDRMSSRVLNGELTVRFQSGPKAKWVLPPRDDKIGIRSIRDEAVEFAEENGATDGQVNAVKKALTDAGYHLIK